jgi:hypothetical protein
MMRLPVRRKARKMEKVKNLCRTATAENIMPMRRNQSVNAHAGITL